MAHQSAKATNLPRNGPVVSGENGDDDRNENDGENGDGDEDAGLDSSLGVYPLETSGDLELGSRLERDHLENGASPRVMPRTLGRWNAHDGATLSSAAATSTPRALTGGVRPSLSSLPPLPQPDFSSPSRPLPSTDALESAVLTPTMNRSFPRPTQSVSPEFPPESPRPSSPEDNSSGVDESKMFV